MEVWLSRNLGFPGGALGIVIIRMYSFSASYKLCKSCVVCLLRGADCTASSCRLKLDNVGGILVAMCIKESPSETNSRVLVIILQRQSKYPSDVKYTFGIGSDYHKTLVGRFEAFLRLLCCG